MEFSNLGKHCNFCKQLDFLPFFCNNCSKYFCKDHRTEKNHNCKNVKKSKNIRNTKISKIKSIGNNDNNVSNNDF